MTRSRPLVLLALVTSIAVFVPSCSALKDAEPWTQTLTYDDNGGKSPVTVTGPDATHPTVLQGDSGFGEIQVVNNTVEERGFAIDDLAVYEKIPAEQSRNVQVQEAKDHHTYSFYDQLHPSQIRGTLVIVFKSAQQR